MAADALILCLMASSALYFSYHRMIYKIFQWEDTSLSLCVCDDSTALVDEKLWLISGDPSHSSAYPVSVYLRK